ncbi:glutamate receptor ionotropic, kainate glr-3-like [Oratosquilla oratoria]|uniref:glutamate receptor ionotropic, kainate glr-3-like n=1 Tax=Oratosquilla oratoria TaxID=337810 RepID=UPI003F761611
MVSKGVGKWEMRQLLFAGDTLLVAGSEEGPEQLVAEFGKVRDRKNLKVNVGENKVMGYTRGESGNELVVSLPGEKLEVDGFKHLGSHKMANASIVRIAAETWEPFMRIAPGEDGVTHYSGVMWDILVILAAKMNLRFEILQPPDGLWGVEGENGSWNGMLGMLERGEVEMALGPFAVSYPRTKVSDFAVPVFVTPHRLYLPRPKGTSDISDFVRLFSPPVSIHERAILEKENVWWLTLASLVLMTLLVLVITRLEERTGASREEPLKSTSTICATVLSIFLQESTWWVGSGWLGRSSLGMWLLLTLVLMNIYRGLLIAVLTVPRVTIPINSVQQLVLQDDLPWRLEQGGIILHTFKTANVPIYDQLMDGSAGFFPDCYAARREIASGQYAALCDQLSGELMISKSFGAMGQCEFYSPRQIIVTHSFSVPFRKKSPLLASANYWLTQLQEYGFVERLLRDTANNGTACEAPPGQESGSRPPPAPLSLTHLAGPFIVFIGGVILAGFFLFLEVIIHYIFNGK